MLDPWGTHNHWYRGHQSSIAPLQHIQGEEETYGVAVKHGRCEDIFLSLLLSCMDRQHYGWGR